MDIKQWHALPDTDKVLFLLSKTGKIAEDDLITVVKWADNLVTEWALWNLVCEGRIQISVKDGEVAFAYKEA